MTLDEVATIHDRLVKQYNLNPTELGRRLIAFVEGAWLASGKQPDQVDRPTVEPGERKG